MTTDHFYIYMLAVLTVNLFPGPDMMYIISQSINKGKRFGFYAALGIGVGCFIHIFAVTLGLSSLIFKSSLAFKIIKYLGAAYLLYIGFSSLFRKQSLLLNQANVLHSTSWKKSFMQGFLSNVLNPKVALFFLAFLPQFIDPSSSNSIGLQMLILGLIFNLSGTTVNIMVALFFGAIKNWLSNHPTILKLQEKITGLILIGLGVRLATLEKA
ncbi:MAG: LysE family translocator [Gammaproteobacteria bacterium]